MYFSTLFKTSFVALLCLVAVACSRSQKTPETVSEERFNNLVWSDEFDGSGSIDTTKWFHQTQLPSGGSWYNDEVQHYTAREDNSFLADGYLNMVAQKEIYTDQGVTKEYTSARLNSKFAFTYGRVEFRAMLPEGFGTWPAVWTLGKAINEPGAYWYEKGFGELNWPACGEIDIMEHWGREQDSVKSAVHTIASHKNGFTTFDGREIPGVSDNFHVYELEWTEDQLVFSVDDTVHYTYQPQIKDKETWPFNNDQYLLLNVAIEEEIDSAFERDTMVIDFIRVYQ
ncbi:MAG: glycoside hydrolase family 16 protein [Bacteroidota bacterium]